MIKIHHFAAIEPGRNIGGPEYSVPSLIAAQDALEGVSAKLVNMPRVGRAGHAVALAASVGVSPKRMGRLVPVDDQDLQPDLAVFHSTYFPSFAVIANALRRRGVPYVLTPRGGLTQGAAQLSRRKKQLANLLFFRRFVNGAAALHTLSRNEYEQTIGWAPPKFIVPNGIDLPPEDQQARPGRGEGLTASFLGRLDINHKGLDLLIEAVGQVAAKLRGAGLRINLYGPDNKRGGMAAVRGMIDTAGVGDIVQTPGPVTGGAKVEALGGSDLFVMTSRFEGMPIALLEGLSFGLPALVTPGTNLADDIDQAGAGWVAEPAPDSIAQRLLELVDSRDELAKCGENARTLVQAKFAWPVVAKQAVAAYQKVLEDIGR